MNPIASGSLEGNSVAAHACLHMGASLGIEQNRPARRAHATQFCGCGRTIALQDVGLDCIASLGCRPKVRYEQIGSIQVKKPACGTDMGWPVGSGHDRYWSDHTQSGLHGEIAI